MDAGTYSMNGKLIDHGDLFFIPYIVLLLITMALSKMHKAAHTYRINNANFNKYSRLIGGIN
ncbi:hypothetical protein ERJ65_02955 [Lactobacillus helveticus]|uniref:Uncharacterized protein n=2 Tax=Lactobacillus helveticus TaxID=1587 RepID=A0AAV4E3P9_LACHE|nr:hypothetical protein [Lactobacillus helveticus]KXN80050.1 hypothetical protein AY471_05095 [Lactobacillus helveticus]MBW7980746.1 hypothetical protein [Lactobacillus helveticus]MBW8000214.1 hypothetical protein [Lactobacillus helveticus]MBW8064086.1 hypothetical protein [Lactobacillus helveticus]MCT3404747.1 hypothetical protein [Lactobacillus helveticus]